MNYRTMQEKLRQAMNYIIIGVVSLIVLLVLPLIGSTLDAGWNLPKTKVAWIVYIVTKVAVSALNVLIFHSFMQQGKLNVMDNQKFLEASKIVNTIHNKELKIRSPKEWYLIQYGKKVPMLFLSTALGLVAFSQAILTFDLMALLSYAIALVLAIIFGFMAMKNNEVYWTEEFYLYAMKIKAQGENKND